MTNFQDNNFFLNSALHWKFYIYILCFIICMIVHQILRFNDTLCLWYFIHFITLMNFFFTSIIVIRNMLFNIKGICTLRLEFLYTILLYKTSTQSSTTSVGIFITFSFKYIFSPPTEAHILTIYATRNPSFLFLVIGNFAFTYLNECLRNITPY